MDFQINYLAVLVAAIINFALGGLWYSKVMFANMWVKAMGLSDEEAAELSKGAAKAVAFSFVAALVMSLVLAYVIKFANADTFFWGMESGFWVWLGFIATTGSASVLFEGKPAKLYFISMSYYLVSLVLMGGVLAVW